MQIEKHRVVSFNYKLTDEDGSVLDSSEGRDPLVYLHGVGAIVPGLEHALEGQSAGDQVSVVVPPEQGYGARNDGLVAEVARSHFEEFDDLELGMQFRIPTDEGNYQVVTVIGIEDSSVTIDANHPLAGMTLHFDVTVQDVRAATEEEIEHGHAHGPGGVEH